MDQIMAMLPGGPLTFALSAGMAIVTLSTARSLRREEAAADTERFLG